jgi:hypothetical protein
VNLLQYYTLLRITKRTERFIFADTEFSREEEHKQRLWTQHLLDLKEWARKVWAGIHDLEVTQDTYPCLHKIIPNKRCNATAMDDCDGCDKDYLLNVALYRRLDEQHPSILVCDFDVAPQDQTYQRAKMDAEELGLEMYYTGNEFPSFIFVYPEGEKL